MSGKKKSNPERYRPPYLGLVIAAAVVFALDIGTKVWASDALESGIIPVIPGTLQFVLAHNEGGAFGLFADADSWWRTPFFVVANLLAVVFLISLYRRLQPDQWGYKWGVPLVLGGALGNFCDRLVHGSVVDFIDYQAGWVELMNRGIHWIYSPWRVTDHWPTFNIADIAICIGLGLIIIQMTISDRKEKLAARSRSGGGKGGSDSDATSVKISG